ncbi:hypothetical protein KML24007_04260 [Alistipes indistinctus]|uniref:HNH endonuclease n=1 Tax=Alistipes indistinctus TaxID=626932 RepID=UPI0036F3012C
MPMIKKTTKRPWQPERGVQEGRLHPNNKFYQSTAWRDLRALKLEQSPLCEECQRKGITTLAQMVDHVVPINQGGAKLDMENLQSLCNPCHNRKSGQEAHGAR